MRDRVALAGLSLAFLLVGMAAALDLASGDSGQFWWHLVVLCVLACFLAVQLRHVRGQRRRPGGPQ